MRRCLSERCRAGGWFWPRQRRPPFDCVVHTDRSSKRVDVLTLPDQNVVHCEVKIDRLFAAIGQRRNILVSE